MGYNIVRNTSVEGTSNSSSHNVTIGGDLHILFLTYNTSGNTISSSTATIGGNSMTKQQECKNGGGGLSEYGVSVYTYIGTLSGSKATVFTWSGGTPTTIKNFWVGYDNATTVDGSDQSGGNGSFENPFSNSVTSSTTNSWLVGCTTSETTTALASLTNFTSLQNNSNDPASGFRRFIGDSNAKVGSGSHSQSFTNGGNNAEFVTVGISGPEFPTLTVTVSSFVLTGINSSLTYGRSMLADTVSFTLTFNTASLVVRLYNRVTNMAKNIMTPTNTTKNSTNSPTNSTKSIITPVNIPKD